MASLLLTIAQSDFGNVCDSGQRALNAFWDLRGHPRDKPLTVEWTTELYVSLLGHAHIGPHLGELESRLNVHPPSLRDADLSGLQVYGLKFGGQNLQAAKLVNSTLTRPRLDRCNLWNAKFSGASIRGGTFSFCNMGGLWENATFVDCEFEHCEFDVNSSAGLRFINCRFIHCSTDRNSDIYRATWTDCKFIASDAFWDDLYWSEAEVPEAAGNRTLYKGRLATPEAIEADKAKELKRLESRVEECEYRATQAKSLLEAAQAQAESPKVEEASEDVPALPEPPTSKTDAPSS